MRPVRHAVVLSEVVSGIFLVTSGVAFRVLVNHLRNLRSEMSAQIFCQFKTLNFLLSIEL